MRTFSIVGLMVVLSCALCSYGSEILLNDTGRVAGGLRVRFSELVTITSFGDDFAGVIPDRQSKEFTFSGGAVASWGSHWLSWAPSTAVILDATWVGPLTPGEFMDPAVEAAVREALWRPTRPLTAEALDKLAELNLRGLGIVDLGGLEHCHSLLFLYLAPNYDPLKENAVSDLAPLADLTDLIYLDLEANRITDISPLSGLDALVRLILSSNEIADISALEPLTSLEDLDLSNTGVSDITPLRGLSRLESLSLRGNRVRDLAPLAGLSTIRSLGLDLNRITDVSPLANLTNMRSLWLGGNLITDISPLAGLVELVRLDLEDNRITDVSVLQGMSQLTELRLSENPIRDLSLVAQMPNLGTLHLSRTGFVDLSLLEGLVNLRRLGLEGNGIEDISPLVRNPGLGEGDYVWLAYNRLDTTPGSEDMRDIEALQERGVTVYYMPQK